MDARAINREIKSQLDRIVGLCLLPGAVFSSMGILLENLHLFASLAVLLLISLIKKVRTPRGCGICSC
jgi:hypothetical protein